MLCSDLVSRPGLGEYRNGEREKGGIIVMMVQTKERERALFIQTLVVAKPLHMLKQRIEILVSTTHSCL